MSARSAIVIGAGLAGLSAALHLARRGVTVDLLEASDRAGGRAASWSSQGFRFDMGPTLLVMTDVLRDTLGERAFDALALRRVEPGYRVLWPDGTTFANHSDIALALAEFARFEPGRASDALRYLCEVYEAHVESRGRILERDHTLRSLLATMLRPGRMRPWMAGNLQRFTRRFFSHPRVVEALTFQPLYLGTSPLRAPAAYALLPVEEMVGGVWYAPGGMGRIVDSMRDECERLGVEFHFDTPVESIAITSAGSVAVSSGRNTRTADALAVASDREPSLGLFGDASRSRAPRYGHSALVFYFGLNRTVDLDHHTVFLPEDPRRAYEELDSGDAPAEPMLYVHNPSIDDASAAPEGGSALLVLLPVPNLLVQPHLDADALRARALDRLEARVGPVREHIVLERKRGPAEFRDELGLMHGAAFGPDHTLNQMGPFRPPIAHPVYRNVAFAGSGTHPGSGVPMVMISGRLAAERLLA